MSWLDVYDWGSRWVSTVVSGRGHEMDRFLDHDHCERKVLMEGQRDTEEEEGGKWFVCVEARGTVQEGKLGGTGDRLLKRRKK